MYFYVHVLCSTGIQQYATVNKYEAINKVGLFAPPFHRTARGRVKYYFPSTHNSWNLSEVKHGNSMWCSFELSWVFMDQTRWAFGEQNIMTLLVFSRGSCGLAIWFQGKDGVRDIRVVMESSGTAFWRKMLYYIIFIWLLYKYQFINLNSSCDYEQRSTVSMQEMLAQFYSLNKLSL